MYKFIILTFLFLGWAFYEMSGGNDFVPMSAQVEQPESSATEAGAAQAAAAPAQVPVVARIEPEPAAEVTRAAYSAEPSFDIRKPDEDELAATRLLRQGLEGRAIALAHGLVGLLDRV